MKSLSSLTNDDEEARLLTNALAKFLHTPGGKMPAEVRLIASSPKSSSALIDPSATDALRLAGSPHFVPLHVRTCTPTVVPP